MNRTPVRFVVREGDPRERLDIFLVARMAEAGSEVSRSTIKRWMVADRVRVDEQIGRASQRLVIGAVVEALPLPPEPSAAVPDPSIAIDVLFEDAHLLVLNKPAGIVVHPAKGHWGGTLVNGLLARGSFARGADPFADPPIDSGDRMGHVRPGIVHRLDQDTSGVLVVAKDDRTREGLKVLFAEHRLERAYVAIVVGQGGDRRIESLHGRHPSQRLKFTSRVTEGKRAVTHVRLLERIGNGATSLVECTLETGRTHQIRVHLSEVANTPILGDRLYGRKSPDLFARSVGHELGRQALLARVLGFVHPITGVSMRFEVDPPEDFRRALLALRSGTEAPPP